MGLRIQTTAPGGCSGFASTLKETMQLKLADENEMLFSEPKNSVRKSWGNGGLTECIVNSNNGWGHHRMGGGLTDWVVNRQRMVE